MERGERFFCFKQSILKYILCYIIYFVHLYVSYILLIYNAVQLYAQPSLIDQPSLIVQPSFGCGASPSVFFGGCVGRGARRIGLLVPAARLFPQPKRVAQSKTVEQANVCTYADAARKRGAGQ